MAVVASFHSVACASSQPAWLNSAQPGLIDEAIAHYEALRDEGGWQSMPDGPMLVPGSRHEQVRWLRNRLRISGDYDADMGADPFWFDGALAAALKNFQQRHGLQPDGRIDHLTRARLNTSVEMRLAQLQHTRAQLAERRQAAVGKRVQVNIPEARLVVLEEGAVQFSQKVIVGHPSRPTPLLSSRFNRVVVNPPWSVPRSIAVRDILPKQKADSSYLARNQIHVFEVQGQERREIRPDEIEWNRLSSDHFPYILRQEPGTFNALGKYKFDFPNSYDVYLHDTPSRDLLGLTYRMLSSGCVRVEDPAGLASWLAGGAGLKQAELLNSGVTRSVPVADEIDVDIIYVMAWVSPVDGAVHFRPDIYAQINADSLVRPSE